jgi:hypothetical protein
MNRLPQERHASSQWEKHNEEQSLSRYRHPSEHSDHSQQTQHGHNNRPDLQLARLRPDYEAQHRSDNGNRSQ